MLNTQWIRELTSLPEQQVIELASRLSQGWEITPKSLPQSGLGMLKLKDGAFHDAFYLGEFPISSAHISITTSQGQCAEGAASLISDKLPLVEALAVCDAILRYQLDGMDELMQAIAQGRAEKEKEERIRQSMLIRTRVDFSLLSSTDEDDE